jgi:tetratricopeptide (TPR) repeat protein
MAGIARLHAKFAGLLSRAAESRAPSAMPVGAADATAAPAAAAPDAIAATIHRAAPVKPAELPELAFDLDASPAPAALPQETAVLSPPPPAPSPSPLLASTPSLPLELDLELDLELELDSPSAAGMDAGPAGTAADAPVEEPTGATLPGASLILPEFIDFGLELAASVETAAGEIDAAPAAVDLPLPMDDAVVAGAGRADEPAGGQGLFDGLETLGEVEPAGESLPDDEDAGIEEFEELEELDDAEGAPPSTGFAALADGGHDAGVFLDEAAAAGFDEALVEGNREDEEDAQSHFDLGIAYKEMGLLNEAIAEFSKAAHQPSRRLDCLTLQGQCRHAMGEYKLAEAIFKEALGSRGLTDEVRVALRYELGLLYETAGLTLEALESFQFVADHDRFFRDVAAKLKSLRQALGLDDPSTDAKGTRPGRDRISYV